MRLTAHTDYGFRMLIYLASVPEQRGTVKGIAEAYGLSHHHLAKIAQRLVRAGVLTSSTGRNGGIALAVDPAVLTVGDIVRAVEEDFTIVECLGVTDECPVSAACGGRNIFAAALRAFFAELDSHTLADVTADRSGLGTALSLPLTPV